MVVISASPTLAAALSDPDTPAGNLQGDFEVRAVTSGTVVVSGAGTVDGSGAAEFQVPAGVLVDRAAYEFRVGARDAQAVTWSSWVAFTVELPGPPGLSMSPCAGSCSNWVTDSATPQFRAVTAVQSQKANYHFEITDPSGDSVTSFTAEDVAAGDAGAAVVPPGALSTGEYLIRFGIEDGDRHNRHAVSWTPGWQPFVVQAPAGNPTTPSCSSPITGTVTWTQDQSPYVLSCGLTVAGGGTLRLEPGTVVKIAGGRLDVNGGRLQANGTGTSPVIFTAYSDDSIMGDTNGDGPSMPTDDGTGYWGQSLTFDSPAPSGGQSSPTSTLDNVAVLYGGKYNGGYAGGCRGSDGAIGLKANARVHIDHSFFDHYDCNAFSGSPVDAGYSVSVVNTVFTGVTPRGGAALDGVHGGTFSGNVFYGSSNYSIMSTVGAVDLNFSNNVFGGYIRFQLDQAPPTGQPMFTGNSFAPNNEPDFLGAAGSFDLTDNWWQRDLNTEPVPTCYVENAFPEYRRTSAAGYGCYRFRIVNKSVNGGYVNRVLPALSEAPRIPGAGLEANPMTGEELVDLWGLSLGSSSNGEFAFRPTGEQSDPVNSAIGSYTEEVTDAALANLGYPLVFGRTYNSADEEVGVMGQGWSTSLENTLMFPEADKARFHASDGQRITFRREDGTWSGASGVTAQLADDGNGYVLTTRAQVRYRFDGQGRVQSILDRNGQGVQFTWANGKVAEASSSGRSLTFSYDDWRLTEVALSDGREVTFTYTNGGHLETATSLGGVTTTYAYDSSGRLESESQTTSSGGTPRTITLMELDYDATTGRVESQTDALGHTSTFEWDPVEQVSTMTAPDGGTWVDDYNDGVLFARVDPLGRTTFYDFDHDLRLTYTRDPRGIVTRLVYNHRDDLIKAHTRSGTTTTEYNNRHDPVKSVDPRGVKSTYEFDANGNLEQTTLKAPGGQTITSSVDPDPATGLPVTSTDETGKVTHFTYHPTSGDLVDIVSPAGRRTHYGYDAAGRLTSSVDPRGYDAGNSPAAYTSTFTYTDDDQPETQTDALGDVTSFTYDDLGRLTAVEDAEGAVTTYTYDDAGHPTTVVQPGPQAPTTEYEYDDNGNLATLTDPDGRTISYTYDRANQLVTQVGPLGTTEYTYDAIGLSTSKTRADGSVTRYRYSNRGYLVGIDYPNSPDVSFTNDAQGNRTSMSDQLGTTAVTYDAFGRPTAASRTFSSGATTANHTYAYLDNGLLQATTGAEGARIFTYDQDGLLKTVQGGAGTLVTYDYDSAGNPVHAVNGDTSAWTRGYDPAGRMVSLTDIAADGTRLLEDTIAYDGVGNPVRITHANGNDPDTHDTYTYDQLTRLTGVCYETTTCDGATDYVKWTYDPVGNRTSEIRPAGTTTYTYDPATGSLASTQGTAGTTTFDYDDLGRLVDDGTTTYTYSDADNLLTETTAGTTTTYGYDGAGNRLRATVGSGGTPASITNEYRDPITGSLLAETDGASLLQRAYIQGLTDVGFTTVTNAGPGNGHWFHTDIQGSVRAVTDNAGAVSSTAEYEPYGVLRSSSTPNPSAPKNPIGWAGEYTDLSGQSHLGARQYDPETGAFVIPDPAETTLPSATYTYASGNPMTRSDPTGLCDVCDIAHDVFVAPVTDAVSAINDAVQVCSGDQKGSCLGAVVKAAVLTLGAVATYSGIGGAAFLAGKLALRGVGYLARRGIAANAGSGTLNWSRATINQGGVSAVERHLARFESGPGETAMLERLRAISRGELDPTDYDLRFYTHELRESVLYRKAGYPSGQPSGSDAAYDLWDRLHTQALTDYGLTRSGAPMDLFHPLVRP